MELGHLLTRSGHTHPKVSSKVCHDSFCQLGNSVSLPWVVCEIMWKNTVEPGRPGMTVWRMRISRWVPKVKRTHTHTHTPYVILLFHCNSGCTNAPHCYAVVHCLPWWVFTIFLLTPPFFWDVALHHRLIGARYFVTA
jgi:hypothetical protein